jgi:hypothetical protein
MSSRMLADGFSLLNFSVRHCFVFFLQDDPNEVVIRGLRDIAHFCFVAICIVKAQAVVPGPRS